jgi:hypothetical protein
MGAHRIFHRFKTAIAATRARLTGGAEQGPYAVAIEFPLLWDAGAPLPTLLQCDQQTFLLFQLAQDRGIGRIEFDGCFATSFGSPGEETFSGHPLYGRGFEAYRAMQVIHSPWIARLQKIDSVHRHHDPSTYRALRHFIFPFHDTMFECVARSFRVEKVNGPLSDAVKRTADCFD